MKKWRILLVVFLCLTFTFINIESLSESKVKIVEHNEATNGGTAGNSRQEVITTEQIYQGKLLLVNQEFPVRQESIAMDVIHLTTENEFADGYGLLDNEIYLSEDITRKFSEMVASAKKDGIQNFVITSGFRDFDAQNGLYETIGSDFALPAGHSEHNLGLALDVGSTQTKMADAKEGAWIEKNAWKHGFILRYPEDKSDITGIQYEPWHIRYVGFPHSAIMQENNFVLEEYLAYLEEIQSITVRIQNEKYTVSYYPITEDTTIDLPENGHYEVSGNNMDGVIVTVYE